LQKKLSERI